MFVNGSGRNYHLFRRPPIDASYQVSVHLPEGFQRRRLKCEKLANDRRRTPSDVKSSHCLRHGELKSIIIIINTSFVKDIAHTLISPFAPVCYC